MFGMEETPSSQFDFWKILKGVSRSFYLSLCFLPSSTRKIVALAYALARAADTLADTYLIEREERSYHLGLFRRALLGRKEKGAPTEEEGEIIQYVLKISFGLTHANKLHLEQVLLIHLKDYFAEFSALPPSDQERVYQVLDVIIRGMEFDLERFPGENPGGVQALDTLEELDQYCYFVAGVVGEFWTRIHGDHLPSMADFADSDQLQWGIRFGKALQMTNILRDIPSDLDRGRCYLPSRELQRFGLSPQALFRPFAARALTPLIDELLEHTFLHYRAAIEYFLEIPLREFRLRFACILPLAIGLKTLAILYSFPGLVLSHPVKIKRKEVYFLISHSLCVVTSNHRSRNFLFKLLREARNNKQNRLF